VKPISSTGVWTKSRELKESDAMAQKRALVVDDSRSARMALEGPARTAQAFASTSRNLARTRSSSSSTHTVDVIFMDHTMPGMDGFETMSVIKGDPRTAMIPVMMYTAKEGEVYVGQARALGAVGRAPKAGAPRRAVRHAAEARPGEVDRRAGTAQPRHRREVAAREGRKTAIDETDRQLERQALGMSVQALVTRVLQDQHLELRSDILASNLDFAKRVAEEILDQAAALKSRKAKSRPPAEGACRVGAIALALLARPAACRWPCCSCMLTQASHEQDVVRAENTR
jgi:CheY-like chemotaxis protein